MRLWDWRLIPFLPKKMLVSQWRECIAIKRQWEKGTLKHRLVSYVMDYNKAYFMKYVLKITDELNNRNIKHNSKFLYEISDFCDDKLDIDVMFGRLDYPEHNDVYLRQCLYNLEEKAMRGLISQEEWEKIYERFKMFTDLWKGV